MINWGSGGERNGRRACLASHGGWGHEGFQTGVEFLREGEETSVSVCVCERER